MYSSTSKSITFPRASPASRQRGFRGQVPIQDHAINLHGIDCVVLSSCYSVKLAEKICLHVPHVIAVHAESSVLDKTARKFNAAFHGSVMPTPTNHFLRAQWSA